jgi:flagellar hook-associated protein 1 FlgK
MSMFNILGTGLSGLQAAQKALDIAGQNISNANTAGYSRQRVDFQAAQVTPTPGLYTGPVTLLNGVVVTGIERVKSDYVQAAASSALAKQAALQSQATPLSNVEALTHEPSDTGLQASLDLFYADWGKLATTPDSKAAGAVVLADGAKVASQLNTLSTGLSTEWSNQRADLTNVVQRANSAAEQVATLNTQIMLGQTGGSNVNDLLDKRDVALDSLIGLVGGVVTRSDDGMVSLLVGGVSLVSAGASSTLSLTGGNDLSTQATDPPALSIGAITITPSSGSAAGLLSALRTDLPVVADQLNAIAIAVKDAVNGLQTTGYTYAGDDGTDFFSGTGARDLAVALTDTTQLAVSSTAGAADGSNAARIATLADDAFAEATLGSPGPSVLWRTLTSGLGAQVQGLNSAIATQTSIVQTAQTAVTEDSGVSLDEETVNMLLFQRSYQASAKIISAADEMLQTLLAMGR